MRPISNPPFPLNRPRALLQLRPHSRLHRPPNLPLPNLRRLRPSQQTPHLSLRPTHRRPTHSPQQPSPSRRRHLRRPLLPLRLPTSTTRRSRTLMRGRRNNRTSSRRNGHPPSSRSHKAPHHSPTLRSRHPHGRTISKTHITNIFSLQHPTLSFRQNANSSYFLRGLFKYCDHHAQ